MNRYFGARRRFLAGLGAVAGAPLLSGLPATVLSRTEVPERTLEAALAAGPARVQVVPSAYPATDVWAYNGEVPGPLLRLRQGERLRVRVTNALAEPTTVHWHGVRVPNGMDGVPVITQPPIAPGGEFAYEFDPPDAGTFFYHPHQRSFEQVARGLAGPLIVEERSPPAVDRDLVWVLGDWRLDRDAAIAGGFGSFMDVSHAGRIGNTVTINGRVPDTVRVRAGERIRLRLINAATARAFLLNFDGHRPWAIALDGQPVEPFSADGGIELGPAMRADLILDMTEAPGSRHVVRDAFYPRREYELVSLVYEDGPAERKPFPEVPRLPRNPLSEPDLGHAERHVVRFSGGMMGNLRDIPRGLAWAINGVAGGCGEGAAAFDPFLVLRRGRTCVLELVNDTAWHHPMHLHGHAFRVLARNSAPSRRREWLDTILLAPRERAEIAFVADNPGDWMFHCHVLDHQAGGMVACVRVS